jgi:hypothetical protein
LIDRSKEAREGVVEALEIVLAPYATCEIQLAFVFAGGPRYQAQDLADFVADTLVTKLPDMTPDAVTLTSEFGDDPWAFGEIRMLVLFNEDCAPASSEGTPVPSASPGQVTATP